jgi:protein SCO1
MQKQTVLMTLAGGSQFSGLRHIMRFVFLASLIGLGAGGANADDSTGPAMQGMDMKGMDMKEMQPMDHMHMPPLPEKGHYTVASKTYDVPDMKLVDANGKEVDLANYLGGNEPVMLNFIFTTCTTLCPVMSGTFREVQGKLGASRKNVHLVSVSIDPENDTPAELSKYAARFKAGPQWTFLTGSAQQSVDMQKAFGVFAGEKMNHTPVTFIKDKGAHDRWLRIDGLASADQIIKEYDKLKAGK